MEARTNEPIQGLFAVVLQQKRCAQDDCFLPRQRYRYVEASLANICLHKSTDAKFYPFTEGDKDL